MMVDTRAQFHFFEIKLSENFFSSYRILHTASLVSTRFSSLGLINDLRPVCINLDPADKRPIEAQYEIVKSVGE